MKTTRVTSKPDRVTSPLLVVFAVDTAEKKPNAKPAIRILAGGAVAKAAAEIVSGGEFAAASCEMLLLHKPAKLKAERLLIVGLGKLTTADVRKAAGAAVRYAKPRKLREVAMIVPEGLDAAAATRAVVEGAYVGDFDPNTYHSDRKDQAIEELAIVAGGAKESSVEFGLREGVILGEAQNFARSLVNEPSNV